MELNKNERLGFDVEFGLGFERWAEILFINLHKGEQGMREYLLIEKEWKIECVQFRIRLLLGFEMIKIKEFI